MWSLQDLPSTPFPENFFSLMPVDAPAVFSKDFRNTPHRRFDPNKITTCGHIPFTDNDVLKRAKELRYQNPAFADTILSKPRDWLDLFNYFDSNAIYDEGAAFLFFVISQMSIQSAGKKLHIEETVKAWAERHVQELVKAHKAGLLLAVVSTPPHNDYFDWQQMKEHEQHFILKCLLKQAERYSQLAYKSSDARVIEDWEILSALVPVPRDASSSAVEFKVARSEIINLPEYSQRDHSNADSPRTRSTLNSEHCNLSAETAQYSTSPSDIIANSQNQQQPRSMDSQDPNNMSKSRSNQYHHSTMPGIQNSSFNSATGEYSQYHHPKTQDIRQSKLSSSPVGNSPCLDTVADTQWKTHDLNAQHFNPSAPSFYLSASDSTTLSTSQQYHGFANVPQYQTTSVTSPHGILSVQGVHTSNPVLFSPENSQPGQVMNRYGDQLMMDYQLPNQIKGSQLSQSWNSEQMKTMGSSEEHNNNPNIRPQRLSSMPYSDHSSTLLSNLSMSGRNQVSFENSLRQLLAGSRNNDDSLQPSAPASSFSSNQAIQVHQPGYMRRSNYQSRGNQDAKRIMSDIWIGNLGQDFDKDEIYNIFSACGKITHYRAVHNHFCAFITFENKQSIQVALIRFNAFVYRGRHISVKPAINRENSTNMRFESSYDTKERHQQLPTDFSSRPKSLSFNSTASQELTTHTPIAKGPPQSYKVAPKADLLSTPVGIVEVDVNPAVEKSQTISKQNLRSTSASPPQSIGEILMPKMRNNGYRGRGGSKKLWPSGTMRNSQGSSPTPTPTETPVSNYSTSKALETQGIKNSKEMQLPAAPSVNDNKEPTGVLPPTPDRIDRGTQTMSILANFHSKDSIPDTNDRGTQTLLSFADFHSEDSNSSSLNLFKQYKDNTFKPQPVEFIPVDCENLKGGTVYANEGKLISSLHGESKSQPKFTKMKKSTGKLTGGNGSTEVSGNKAAFSMNLSVIPAVDGSADISSEIARPLSLSGVAAADCNSKNSSKSTYESPIHYNPQISDTMLSIKSTKRPPLSTRTSSISETGETRTKKSRGKPRTKPKTRKPPIGQDENEKDKFPVHQEENKNDNFLIGLKGDEKEKLPINQEENEELNVPVINLADPSQWPALTGAKHESTSTLGSMLKQTPALSSIERKPLEPRIDSIASTLSQQKSMSTSMVNRSSLDPSPSVKPNGRGETFRAISASPGTKAWPVVKSWNGKPVAETFERSARSEQKR